MLYLQKANRKFPNELTELRQRTFCMHLSPIKKKKKKALRKIS